MLPKVAACDFPRTTVMPAAIGALPGAAAAIGALPSAAAALTGRPGTLRTAGATGERSP